MSSKKLNNFFLFLKKYKKTSIFVLVFFIIFLFILIMSQGKIYEKNELEYGITFSSLKAKELGLDWKKAYTDILDELQIKKIRLSAYWNEIEKINNQFYFDDLDWELKEAKKRNVEIILAVGGRLPRWPECHFPNWTENMSEEERERETLKYIEKTINRYKSNENIVAWQVENEPFLSSHFGECPSLNINFLDKEIELVKKLDKRPVVITDSGELSVWVPAAKRADIFGITMYRNTYSEKLKSYVHYPIGPGFFRFKKNITDWFASPQKWIVIELQAEPWGSIPYQELKKEERDKTMDEKKFLEIIEFARLSGFKEFYLWGAEYWYWEKVNNENDKIWEEAKKLFK